MEGGTGRFDLRRLHQTLMGNLQYLRVTAGTLAWFALYVTTVLLWWKLGDSPDLSLVIVLLVVGVLLLGFTLDYPLRWMRARRLEFRQVLQTYYDYVESLPPDSRTGPKSKALWESVMQLHKGLDEAEHMAGSINKLGQDV